MYCIEMSKDIFKLFYHLVALPF